MPSKLVDVLGSAAVAARWAAWAAMLGLQPPSVDAAPCRGRCGAGITLPGGVLITFMSRSGAVTAIASGPPARLRLDVAGLA